MDRRAPHTVCEWTKLLEAAVVLQKPLPLAMPAARSPQPDPAPACEQYTPEAITSNVMT
jgi:hypothetical protein